jgi:hypothetical protein
VDEVVAILRDVARDRGRCLFRQLNAEAVVEDTAVPVAVIRAEHQGEIGGLRAVATDVAEHSRKQVAAQIRRHVPARLMLSDRAKFRSLDPLQQLIVRSTIALRQP